MTDIISRAEAKAVGLKHYFTGKPCNHGHICLRQTTNGGCVECILEKQRKRRVQNPEHMRALARRSMKKWRDNNPEASRRKSNVYYLANHDAILSKQRETYRDDPERYRERARNFKINNPDRAREINNRATKRWKLKNPTKVLTLTNKRRAQKFNATPPWADHSAIEAIYAEARRLTEETGIPHEVDHIHPLQGENFCGLHVPYNLQVIPAEQNRRKGNKLMELSLAA